MTIETSMSADQLDGIEAGADALGGVAKKCIAALVPDEAVIRAAARVELVGELRVELGVRRAAQFRFGEPRQEIVEQHDAGKLVVEVLEQIVRRAAMIGDRRADADRFAARFDAGLAEVAAEDVAVTID